MSGDIFTVRELDEVGLIGELRCTCLDEFSPYLTDTGFCSFCEAVEKAKANAAQSAKESSF